MMLAALIRIADRLLILSFKVSTLIEEIHTLVERLNHMAKSQADLDASLSTLTDAVTKLVAIQPVTPVSIDLENEVAIVDGLTVQVNAKILSLANQVLVEVQR